MSSKYEILSLAGIDLSNKSTAELSNLYKKYLKKGMHGLCFSAYQEGQEPGDQLSEAQIRKRMEIIKPMAMS